jgi:imidazolonepropionase-like amidohydrolase
MNMVYIALLPLFIFSLSDTLSLVATDSTAVSNTSLSLLNKQNGNETLVLQGATLIDGTGASPKINAEIIIYDNKIIVVTNQTNYKYNLLSNDRGRSLINERVLNLTGKYIMPGLFDTHAHVAGVRKNSYDQATSENMLGMLLNSGVTTIRNPGGPTIESVQLREEVFDGDLKGPEIFTAGRLLNTPEIPIPFVEKRHYCGGS